MRDYQTRRKWQKLLHSRASLLVLIFLVLLLSKSVWDIYTKTAVTRVNRERVVAELALLEERKVELDSRIARMHTTRGIEEEVRKNLPVVKEGEKVVTIVRDDKASSTPNAWWRRWVGVFRK